MGFKDSFRNIRERAATKRAEFDANQARRREQEAAHRLAVDEDQRTYRDADTSSVPANRRPVVRETTRKSGWLKVVAAILFVILFLFAVSSCNGYRIETENLKSQLSEQGTKAKQPVVDEFEKFKTDAAAREKALQDKLATSEAEKKAAQEALKNQPAAPVAPPAAAPSVGNADGEGTPPAAQAEAAIREAELNRRLTELGYDPNSGWKRNLTDAEWADIANNNPGQGVVGNSFAKTPEEAAAAAKNNPTVAGTYEQKADPKNWVLVYNKACMSYGKDMAFQISDGSFGYPGANDDDFRECGVGIWVNLASGGQFRLLCDNGLKAAPVPTNKPASFKEITPIKKLTPPTTTTTVVYNPPKEVPPPVEEKMEVCIKGSGDQTMRPINKKDYNPRIHSTNPADCVKPVEEKMEVCIKGSGDQTMRPINKKDYNPRIHSTNPADCVKAKDPTKDPEQNGNAPDNGTPMPDPGPATPPAVPETDAPDVVTIPAPPAPAPTTPRPADELPTNEGATPAAPTTGTVDETVCEVCGGGMSDTTQVAAATIIQAAPVAAPAAAAPAAVEVSAPAVTVSAPLVEAAPASPATSAPAISEPAPTQTQVAVDVTPSTAVVAATSVDTTVG